MDTTPEYTTPLPRLFATTMDTMNKNLTVERSSDNSINISSEVTLDNILKRCIIVKFSKETLNEV